MQTYQAAILHNDSLKKLRDNSTFEKTVWVRIRYKNGNISGEALLCVRKF
jgi:hypothetical protein